MALLNFKLYTFVRIFHLKYKENNLPRGLGKINDEIFECLSVPGRSLN